MFVNVTVGTLYRAHGTLAENHYDGSRRVMVVKATVVPSLFSINNPELRPALFMVSPLMATTIVILLIPFSLLNQAAGLQVNLAIVPFLIT